MSHGNCGTGKYNKEIRKGDDDAPLDDVSLDLARGDFLSLMGPSGTGKSTLLNLVSGIDRPDSGTIVVNGTEDHSRTIMDDLPIGARKPGIHLSDF